MNENGEHETLIDWITDKVDNFLGMTLFEKSFYLFKKLFIMLVCAAALKWSLEVLLR